MPYFRAFQLFWLRLPYLWIQSLLWWISIVSYFDIQVNPCWNRTLTYHFSASISLNHDWTLGGPRYIHLTKGTNAVFSGFFSLLATVAISMNPITFVMNFYCNLLWHPGQSLLESNSDLSLLKFQRCQPWLNLRRRLLYPFNYENKCRIFGLFSLFSGYGDLLYNSYQLLDELPFFLPLWFFLASAFFTSEQKPFFCFGFCYIQNLGGACYIHLTTRTNAVFSSFSAFFGYGDLLYELNHFCDESSVFLFRHFYMPQFKSNS